MLKAVEVGSVAREHTLVVTPEFFAHIRKVANRSWGARIRLRLYPWVFQWVVVEGIPSTPDDCICFDIDRVPVLIPKKYLQIFNGKVLGYEIVVPGFIAIGFIDPKG